MRIWQRLLATVAVSAFMVATATFNVLWHL